MRRIPAALILGMGMIAGCGGESPFDRDGPRRAPAMGVGGQLAPVDLPGQGGNKPQKNSDQPPSSPPHPATPDSPSPPQETASDPPVTPPNVERTVVRPGVTGRGQTLGSGPISTPLKVYFTIGERVVFDMQIPHTMNIYRALNGHFPKSHEEFMEKVIKANGLKLPELRTAEERYVYLPEKAAKMSTYDAKDPPLVVERPR